MTQFPGVSIGTGAPRKKSRCASCSAAVSHFDPLRSPFLHPTHFVSLFSPRHNIRSAENFRKKNRNPVRGDASFLSPSSRETSSAKCPTKIGICRECRIPEVRSGLSEELLKVPRVLLISFLLSGAPRVFPLPRRRSCIARRYFSDKCYFTDKHSRFFHGKCFGMRALVNTKKRSRRK